MSEGRRLRIDILACFWLIRHQEVLMKIADAWRAISLMFDVTVGLLFILYCTWVGPKVLSKESR